MYRLLKNYYHQHYRHNYLHAKKLFIFDLILFLTAIFALGTGIFLSFWKPSTANLLDISLSFGETKIKSGDEIRLTLNYANHSQYALRSVSLGLRLPEGFVINRDKTAKNIFSDDSIFPSVNTLAPGASGQTEIYGSFWNEPNKDTRFVASLSYQLENKSGREQKLASLIAKLADSVLTGQLFLPTSTLPNFPLEFTYVLRNSGARTIDNISIASDWPGAVTLEETAANFSLSPNESRTITGNITTPNKSGTYSFSLTPRVFVNNTVVAQSASIREFKIFAPEIISRVKLLPALNYAEPGQNFPINISWENKSGFKLQNITLHLTANLPNVVDWKKTAKENRAQPEASGLFFDSQSRTNLANGNPDSADNFDVTIYLLPNFNLAETENANLEIYPVVKGQIAQISGQEFSQEGSRLRLPLATEVTFNEIAARYYTSEGDQLGRGSLPPQMGKTTKYWIVVNIANTSNALNDAVFTGLLPEGVEFTGKQSVTVGPQIIFNPASRAVSWRHSSLPAYSRTGLYFEVAITPKNSQVGQTVPLAESLKFSAMDDFTGKKFNLSHTLINNVLPTGDRGRVFGAKVVE